jgi:hypothetical protein
MRTWKTLMFVLIWGACSSGSGAKDATMNQPDARPATDTNEGTGEVADSAAKPTADATDAIIDSGKDAPPSDPTDAPQPDSGKTVDMGAWPEVADVPEDAPSDSPSSDLGEVDARESYCGVAVTGSCYYDTFGVVSCTDYTDTDPTLGESRCSEDASGVWSPQPCPLAPFDTGCRYGTPGVAGCYVSWVVHGSANYQVACLGRRGSPIRLH